jgi:hypothetical protein
MWPFCIFAPLRNGMKRFILLLIISLTLSLVGTVASAQCSICTRTAAQLGEKPARGLNLGILYLAAIPYAMVGFIAYRWWKNGEDEVKEA